MSTIVAPPLCDSPAATSAPDGVRAEPQSGLEIKAADKGNDYIELNQSDTQRMKSAGSANGIITRMSAAPISIDR